MGDNWIHDGDFIKPVETFVVDGIVWERYEIDVPDDLYLSPDERWDLAYLEAHEKCEVYVVPCEWEMISDDGKTVTLWRKYRGKKA